MTGERKLIKDRDDWKKVLKAIQYEIDMRRQTIENYPRCESASEFIHEIKAEVNGMQRIEWVIRHNTTKKEWSED